MYFSALPQKKLSMHPYILSTERLGLRKWIDSDIPPFIEMNKDADVMKYFPKVLTDEETVELVERIRLHHDKNNFGLFAVENKQTNEFIGFTGFSIPAFDSFFTPCVEIGWRYKKEAWGYGFATEAANACCAFGFESLAFDKIVSFTSAVNVNSEKVMKRIGMKYISDFDHPKIEKNSALCRHVLYAIEKNHFTT
jgi:ribosomal-protein-alanine N-acetyltransferase